MKRTINFIVVFSVVGGTYLASVLPTAVKPYYESPRGDHCVTLEGVAHFALDPNRRYSLFREVGTGYKSVTILDQYTSDRHVLETVDSNTCIHDLQWDAMGERGFFVVTTFQPTAQSRISYLDLSSPDPFAATTVVYTFEDTIPGVLRLTRVSGDTLTVEGDDGTYEVSLGTSFEPRKIE